MPENLDTKLTADAWAKITIKIWEETFGKMNIKNTGAGVQSFYHFVNSQAEGDQILVEFTFKYYLYFVDWGVGKNVDIEHRKLLASTGTTNRKKKPWFTSTFYTQVERLTEEMAKKYALKAAHAIIDTAKQDAE